MKKQSIWWMLTLYSLFFFMSNFVHPVTPAFLQSINCPDYMFGVSFAAMAFFTFLSSPFWGRMGDLYGYGRMMGFCIFGYCAGQFLFSIALDPVMVVVGRSVGGFFACSLAVNSMAYITANIDENEKRGKYLSIYTALSSITAALGFLVGGLIGDYNISLVFQVQIALGILIGFVTIFLIKDSNVVKGAKSIKFKEVNPISSIISSAKAITIPMAVFLLIVFLANFATFAHDQSFNYYLRAQLDFPSSANGIFKSLVGVIGLVANMTINMWIIKKADCRKAITYILALCSISLAAMVSVSGIPLFITMAALYYTFSAVFLPVLQVLMVKGDNVSSKGTVAGLFNAAKSLGMMAGPLFSGFAYGINPTLPFIGASVVFAVCVILAIFNKKQYDQ